MNIIKSLVGKLTEFGTIIASSLAGFICGMVAVHTVDLTLYFILGTLGFHPLAGIPGAVVGLALGLCYAVIYLVIALRVCDKVENYINNCREEFKFRRVYVVA